MGKRQASDRNAPGRPRKSHRSYEVKPTKPRGEEGGPKRTPLTFADAYGVGDKYAVEAILAEQVINGRRSYHVKWQDLPVAANTWEPEGHLVGAHAEALLAAFKDLQAARVKVRCAPA